jgi:chemotaxis protein histidine kinase CheA
VVFVSSYRALLPQRVRRIAAGLAAAQVDHEDDDAIEDAMDAVLSLKVASAIVGAYELADIATRLERLLRRGDLARAVVVETALAGAAARADRALGAFLAS